MKLLGLRHKNIYLNSNLTSIWPYKGVNTSWKTVSNERIALFTYTQSWGDNPWAFCNILVIRGYQGRGTAFCFNYDTYDSNIKNHVWMSRTQTSGGNSWTAWVEIILK